MYSEYSEAENERRLIELEAANPKPNPYFIYTVYPNRNALVATCPTLEIARELVTELPGGHEHYIYNAELYRVVWRSNPTPEEQETAQLRQRVKELETQMDFCLNRIAHLFRQVHPGDSEAVYEINNYRKGAQ